MRNTTILQVKEHLTNLADVYGMRPPSDGALKVWVSALSCVEEKFALQALTLWPDHNRKMPAPADIRNDAFNLQSAWYEKEREIEKAQFARAPTTPNPSKVSPAFMRAFNRHQAIANMAAKHQPDDQWQWNLLDRWINQKPNADGTPLYAIQIDILKQCFGNPIPMSAIQELPKHKDRYQIPPFEQILTEEQAKAKEAA